MLLDTDRDGRLSSVQLQAIREQLQTSLMWRTLQLDQLLGRLRDGKVAESDKVRVFTDITTAETKAAKIQEALERMRDGSYARCERCDGPIGYADLRPSPLLRQCRDCRDHGPSSP